MRITNVVPRRKGLSALYIDGEFAMKIDTEAFLASRLSVGSEITDEELKELAESSAEKRARERAIWLISYRDHSKRELEEKVRRSADPDSARKAVERMEELGLVDDEKFARRYARELIFVKHLSVRGARYKLVEKGVDRSLADEVLEELDPDPREHIAIIIEKKYKNLLSDEKQRRRAVVALQRMGYGWSDISAVLSRFAEEDTYEV